MADAAGFPVFCAPLDPVNRPIRRCPVPAVQASRRILIQRTGAHGDILMATPLLGALRAAWPEAHLTWLVDRKERETIDAHPEIDEVLLWSGLWWKRQLRQGRVAAWLRNALAMRRLFRERRYDIFISLQGEEWPTIARFCGAPTRIGVFDTFWQLRRPDASSARRRRHYTASIGYPDLPEHRTEQFLWPLSALGLDTERGAPPMSMGFTQGDRQAAEAAQPAGERAPVVLAPQTSWATKNWPAERYAALADRLQDDGWLVALVGAPGEAEAVAQVASAMRRPAPTLAGALSFRALAALVARSALVVSGDTGPMHLAAAVGTPYLALFGATPAEALAPRTGPGRTIQRPVPCGPCYRMRCANGSAPLQCLLRIEVDEVHACARELLA